MKRRQPARRIAKVNATSIDGYFGEGTPCFFIRGTILSDAPIDGEYRTLLFQRPGNHIEVSSFDGTWAMVTVTTRGGNREGDNLRARLWLRHEDLKPLGVDCARVVSGDDTAETIVPDLPVGAQAPPETDSLRTAAVVADVVRAAEAAAAGSIPAPQLFPGVLRYEAPVLAAREAPAASNGRRAEPIFPEPLIAPEPPVPAPVAERAATVTPPSPPPVPPQPKITIDFGKLLENRRGAGPFGPSTVFEVGAAIAAVALPLLWYFALAIVRARTSGDEPESGIDETA